MLATKRSSGNTPLPEKPHLTPVPFIVGTGRCGTTLLRLMLDAHPELAIPPETHFFYRAVTSSMLSSDPREGYLTALTCDVRWPDFQLSAELLRGLTRDLEPFNLSDAFRTFYSAYAKIDGKTRWGDKTPDHSGQMDLIEKFIPEAHFIHLIRDGRDVALSLKELWFGPRSFQEVGGWWASKIKAARDQVSRLRHYLEIRYEDLVSRPEPTLKQVCDFLELSWNPVMLDYHKTAKKQLRLITPVLTQDRERMINSEQRQGIHQLTSKPPQRERIARWRTEMSQADQQVFEKTAGWLLREFGYEVSHCESHQRDQQEQKQSYWFDFIERLEAALKELAALIPSGQSFILVDDNQWGVNGDVIGRYPIPFLECNGEYWGPPENDNTAIRELGRLRQSEAKFIVFAWPAFWWLDYYKDFHDYLRYKFACILQNERLVIFDLGLERAARIPEAKILQGEAGVRQVAHRAYVGGLWEKLGRLQFDFLVSQGLEPHHYLCDVACVSLRGGVHFIRFLERGHYQGIEKEKWLVQAGVAQELGEELNRAKAPELVISAEFEFSRFSHQADFALAQSLFTHLPQSLIEKCLTKLRTHMVPRGVLYATFFETPTEYQNPREPDDHGYFAYTRPQMLGLGAQTGWRSEYIGAWGHPREQVMVRYTTR